MTSSELSAHSTLSEPQLKFHPTRDNDVDIHPLRGLVSFGPYSRALIHNAIDPIRLAVVVPAGRRRQVTNLLGEMAARHAPRERRDYLVEWPGFNAAFGLRLAEAGDDFWVELPADMESKLHTSKEPYRLLADQVGGALNALDAKRTGFDVVLLYLPDEWSSAFEDRDSGFDLHDYIKAVAASRGVPTQVVNDHALTYFCRCSVMWRLGIALYTKAGGVPWKLANAEEGVAHVGLSYALRFDESGKPRFVTCCSQVFDAQGAGLQFVVYEARDFKVWGDNPYLTREEMRRVVSRTLDMYQKQHAGQLPRRLVVHKTTEFRKTEAEGVFDALRSVEDVELLQLKQDIAWRAVKIEAPRTGSKGQPAGYPVDRGTLLPTGPASCLLWTQGNSSEVAPGRNYFKEGKGTPSPLEIVRFAGHGDWHVPASEVLRLTKMNWNNDALYDRLPVTIVYAQRLAGVIKRMPSLSSAPYAVRLFI